ETLSRGASWAVLLTELRIAFKDFNKLLLAGKLPLEIFGMAGARLNVLRQAEIADLFITARARRDVIAEFSLSAFGNRPGIVRQRVAGVGRPHHPFNRAAHTGLPMLVFLFLCLKAQQGFLVVFDRALVLQIGKMEFWIAERRCRRLGLIRQYWFLGT